MRLLLNPFSTRRDGDYVCCEISCRILYDAQVVPRDHTHPMLCVTDDWHIVWGHEYITLSAALSNQGMWCLSSMETRYFDKLARLTHTVVLVRDYEQR